LKLVSDKESLAENKVLILYILDKVGKPIDSESLFKLVVSSVDMNYFYFQQFLLDLTQNKYVTSHKKEDTDFIYEITPEGKEVLKLTASFLPGILKLKIDSNFKDELNNIKKEISVTADFTPRNETEFIVTCHIKEDNDIIFEVQTLAGSREHAKAIVENWKNNANDIYPKILELLSK